MRTAMLLGLAAWALGGCGGEPLGYDQTAMTAPVPSPTPVIDEIPPPAPRACMLEGLNFFEYACPGHPGCVRCKVIEINGAGTGTVPTGCLAPSGGACIDYCEYCPTDPGPRS